MDAPTNQFQAWAVVEMFGHVKEIGFVTTEYYGGAALFRVDTPEMLDREYVLERAEYGFEDPTQRSMKFLPAGAKVRRKGTPAKSRLVGPGAIYSITPCTEETAMRAIDRLIDRPLVLRSSCGATKAGRGQSQTVRAASVSRRISEEREK